MHRYPRPRHTHTLSPLPNKPYEVSVTECALTIFTSTVPGRPQCFDDKCFNLSDWQCLITVVDDDDDVDRASCPRMSADMLGTNCDQCLSMVTSAETVRLT